MMGVIVNKATGVIKMIGQGSQYVWLYRSSIQHTIPTIPGMGLNMRVIVLTEIGDFYRFDSPDKIFDYAGLSSPMYRSSPISMNDTCFRMEKHDSNYLRYTLL